MPVGMTVGMPVGMPVYYRYAYTHVCGYVYTYVRGTPRVWVNRTRRRLTSNYVTNANHVTTAYLTTSGTTSTRQRYQRSA